MTESPFGFEYSWDDLRPIRPLFFTVLAGQLVGGVIALSIGYFPDWFQNLWTGAAIACLPGFVIGIFVQNRVRAGAISENPVMVRRLGLIAAVFTMAGVTTPWWWHAG